MEKEVYMIVTPELAQELLKSNTKNRFLSKATVKIYANDMKRGKWNWSNKDPIVINKFNVLENGQHRLYAVIYSGVPTMFKVVTGSEPAAETYDRGRPRTAADALRISGKIENPSNLNLKIALVRLFVKLSFNINKLSDRTIEDYIFEHQDDIHEAVRIVSLGKTVAISRKKELALAAYCAMRCSIPKTQLIEFFTVVNTGFMDYKWQTPAILLRNKIMEFKTTGSGSGYSKELYLTAEYAIRDYVKMSTRTNKYKITENTKFIFLSEVKDRDKGFFVEED